LKSARTKACEIPLAVKEKVYERDGGRCVICGRNGSPDMHYIPRSAGGLGIEQNIVCGCPGCHRDYDNGSALGVNYREVYGGIIKTYLDEQYPGFENEDRIFHKYKELK